MAFLISPTSSTLSCTEYTACSMNLRRLRHTLDLARVAFSRKPVFGRKVVLIFPIIYQIVDQNLALWSLLTIPWIPDLSSFNWFGGKNEQFSHFAHIFQRDQTCLASPTSPTLKLSYLLYLSCPNQSTWWLCRRHTRSTTPWWIKSGPSMSN